MKEQDFYNRLQELYAPPEKIFSLIDVPQMKYVMVDGHGNPEGQEFAAAIKWLFSVIYPIKPIIKKRLGKKFVEPPLECLYWSDNINDFILGNKDQWKWRVMIVMLDWVSEQIFTEAVAKVEKKLGPAPESLRLEHIHEGKSVQIMHIGDYTEIGAICDKLYNEYLPQNNLTNNGHYHEIYLNDPTRVAPKKRKMILRQPVR